MSGDETEKIVREYLELSSEAGRTYLGTRPRYVLETRNIRKGRWEGRIRREVPYPVGNGCESLLLDYVPWTRTNGRKKLLEVLLSLFSGGKTPEETSLELASAGRSGSVGEPEEMS